jgi:ribosome-associated protein
MLTPQQEEMILEREVNYHTSRSGGKGGQNVNKVETRVEIEFNVHDSKALTDEQKAAIRRSYPALIRESVIRLAGNKYRTQLRNKQYVNEKLILLLRKLLKPVIKRKPTRPKKSAREKTLKEKKQISEKKLLRQKIR